MDVSKRSGFYYHADANALGGHLVQPVERVVTTEASSSLAHAGGFGSTRVEQFHVDGVITVDTARSHVSGSEHKDRGYRSIATASVEGLNILDIVTADRIVAQLTVMHPYDNAPAEISLLGTQLVNLCINGEPIHPVLDRRVFGAGRQEQSAREAAVSHAPGFRDLLEVAELQFEERGEQRQVLVDTLGKRFDYGRPSEDLREKGSALCTLVQSATLAEPGAAYGHVLHIPDFGNVFLGELYITPFAVELTMLRAEMGCIAQGTVSAGSARSNGRYMP